MEAGDSRTSRDGLIFLRASHGIRSSFQDRPENRSNAPREVCELALAHVDWNSIEAACRQTDLRRSGKIIRRSCNVLKPGSHLRFGKIRMRSFVGFPAIARFAQHLTVLFVCLAAL